MARYHRVWKLRKRMSLKPSVQIPVHHLAAFRVSHLPSKRQRTEPRTPSLIPFGRHSNAIRPPLRRGQIS